MPTDDDLTTLLESLPQEGDEPSAPKPALADKQTGRVRLLSRDGTFIINLPAGSELIEEFLTEGNTLLE